jgi:hypothetical protein
MRLNFFSNKEKTGQECCIMFSIGHIPSNAGLLCERPAEDCSGHFLRFSVAIEEVI